MYKTYDNEIHAEFTDRRYYKYLMACINFKAIMLVIGVLIWTQTKEQKHYQIHRHTASNNEKGSVKMKHRSYTWTRNTYF